MGNETKLNVVDVMVYLSMETGMALRDILELPVSVFNTMLKGVSNIYEEKNRLQEEALKNG